MSTRHREAVGQPKGLISGKVQFLQLALEKVQTVVDGDSGRRCVVDSGDSHAAG